VEAPRPSAKLSTIDALPSVAANRGTEPAKLSRLMKGELDWLVLKALEKDRTRRYETANGLARDIQRSLADEVVEARPPSVGYRVSKFVRRHRGQVLAAGLVLLALLAGIAGTTFGLFRAEAARRDEAQQRAAAEKAAAAERLAKLDADARRQEAETNLAFARKGNEILGSVFAGLDPKANYATVAELSNALRDNLNKAVKDLEGSAIGEPLEVAAMQDTLGLSLVGLGEASLAVEVLQKALGTRKAKLGPDHPDTLRSMNELAVAYQDCGQLTKAVPLFEETLEKTKATLGPDHSTTLTSMSNQALAYEASGRLAKAVTLFKETLEKTKATLGPEHPNTLASMENLARAYRYSGQLAKAVPLHEKTLEKRKATLGADHPDTLISMGNLAAAYHASGQLAKAVPLHEETLEKQKAKVGLDHPETLVSMNNLALAYQASGQLAKAVLLLEETLEKRKAKLGPDHPNTLRTKKALDFARALLAAGGRYRAKLSELGPKHFDTLLARRDLAQMYMATNRLDDAELVLLEVLHGMNDRAADDAIVVFTTGLLRHCLTQRQQATPNAWQTFNTQSLLGGALLGQKKYAEAEPLLFQGYEGLKAREQTIPKHGGGELRIPEALDRLIELYTAISKPDEAKKWRAERAKYPQGNTKTPQKK
jgi:hypothetical protein